MINYYAHGYSIERTYPNWIRRLAVKPKWSSSNHSHMYACTCLHALFKSKWGWLHRHFPIKFRGSHSGPLQKAKVSKTKKIRNLSWISPQRALNYPRVTHAPSLKISRLGDYLNLSPLNDVTNNIRSHDCHILQSPSPIYSPTRHHYQYCHTTISHHYPHLNLYVRV